MPTLFLCLALFGAVMTANAFVAQRRFTPFIIPSFFSGWLVSELPLHHIAWQAIATVAFVAGGALEAWQGWVGLVVTMVSWGGLLALRPIAQRSQGIVDASLSEALGQGYDDSWTQESAEAMKTPALENRKFWVFKMRHPAVEVTRDLPYIDDGNPPHMLDIYAPKTPVAGMSPAPVLLQIHGGGWMIIPPHHYDHRVIVDPKAAACVWPLAAEPYKVTNVRPKAAARFGHRQPNHRR